VSTSESDIRWIEKVANAYQDTLVRFEIARQDLAVAVAEKDALATHTAQQRFGEWRERRVQLEKLLEGVIFMRKAPGAEKKA